MYFFPVLIVEVAAKSENNLFFTNKKSITVQKIEDKSKNVTGNSGCV